MKAFMVINNKGKLDSYFVNPQKKGLINHLVQYYENSWEEIKKYGWRIVKVNIEIEPVLLYQIEVEKLPKSVLKKLKDTKRDKTRFNI